MCCPSRLRRLTSTVIGSVTSLYRPLVVLTVTGSSTFPSRAILAVVPEMIVAHDEKSIANIVKSRKFTLLVIYNSNKTSQRYKEVLEYAGPVSVSRFIRLFRPQAESVNGFVTQ